MNKTLLVVLIVVGAIALGVGGAYAAGQALADSRADEAVSELTEGTLQQQTPEPPPEPGEKDDTPRLWPWGDKFTPPNLMKKAWKRPDWPAPGWREPRDEDKRFPSPRDREDDDERGFERLAPQDALAEAQAYVAQVSEIAGEALRVDKLLRFSNGYLAIITEENTGRGAFRLLVNPVNGKVKRFSGADVNWNTKYLRRGVVGEATTDNVLTMPEAAARAAEELSMRQITGEVVAQGYAFYGYYAFEYQEDGVTAGMVAVNGESGQVWVEKRPGEFPGEEEMGE